MIDYHTHVLPGIDDGSADLRETMLLLEEEKRQGVDRVVATPHFYATKSSFSAFLAKRDHAYDTIGDAAPVKILKAAEVYYFPGIGGAEQIRDLVIEGTDLLLLEMPFAQWTESVLRDVEVLIHRQKLTVILAHLERFYPYQRSKAVWDEVLDLPVVIQLNAGSFLEWKKRRFDLHLMRSGRPVLLGSDCHNMAHRPPNLAEGRAVIEKKLGSDALRRLDQYADTLLEEHQISL